MAMGSPVASAAALWVGDLALVQTVRHTRRLRVRAPASPRPELRELDAVAEANRPGEAEGRVLAKGQPIAQVARRRRRATRAQLLDGRHGRNKNGRLAHGRRVELGLGALGALGCRRSRGSRSPRRRVPSPPAHFTGLDGHADALGALAREQEGGCRVDGHGVAC